MKMSILLFVSTMVLATSAFNWHSLSNHHDEFETPYDYEYCGYMQLFSEDGEVRYFPSYKITSGSEKGTLGISHGGTYHPIVHNQWIMVDGVRYQY